MNAKTYNLLEFERVQNSVAAHLRADEAAEMLAGQPPLTDKTALALLIKNIKSLITLINSGSAEPRGTLPPLAAPLKKLGIEGLYFSIDELYALGVFLEEGKRISDWAGALFNDISLGAVNEAAVSGAAKIIFSVIDHDGKFRDTPETRRIKAKIAEINRELQALTASYSRNEATRFMLRSGPPSIREGRTVIALKANFRGRIRGIVHEVSASGQTLFIEPEDVVEKNNDLRIAEHELDAEIRRVLAEASAALSPLNNDIIIFYNELLYFETLRARAHYAIASKGVFAASAASAVQGFMLRGARHPLLKNPVPIDIEMNDNVHALVISGPNAGGKTAALKTAGLFALMHQCGFALPAADAALPVFDNIFCDIGDEQSLDGALSTFSAHIKNISEILRSATKNSLVLLDELGTGTGIEEGAALAMAMLDTFIERGAMLIVSTHAGALKNYALTNSAACNASVEFDGKTRQPTYRVINGVPGESRAIVIAEKNGIDRGITARARAYLEHGGTDSTRAIAALLEKNAQLLREKEALNAEKAAFAAQKEKFALREKKILEKEAALKAGDAGELRALLNESRKKLENLVRALQERGGKLEREDTLAVKSFLRELEDDINDAVLETSEPEDLAQNGYEDAADGAMFTPGMNVLVGERRRLGIIKRRGKKGTWIVETGSVSLAFSENELLPAPARKSAAQNAAAPSVLLELAPDTGPVHAEIDLHGLRLADAIEALRRQLDTAITAGLFRFAVIHGAGDGILQRGVHEFLKAHAGENGIVANYYFSRPEFGGTGRTEVELRF